VSDEQVVDAEVEEIGTDVVPAPTATLFRTDDPAESVERMTAVANALKEILTKQGLTARISNKEHVLVEGWTTLGALVGVTPVPVWTRPLEGDAPGHKAFGYEARVEARTLDGRVVGAAESMCTRDENRWRNADDYAIRSMAQTRATSKALRGPLGFIVTLAGFESTPAEEMPAAPAPAPTRAEKPLASLGRKGVLNDLTLAHGWSSAEFANAILREAGAPPKEFESEERALQYLQKLLLRLPEDMCETLIDRLATDPQEATSG